MNTHLEKRNSIKTADILYVKESKNILTGQYDYFMMKQELVGLMKNTFLSGNEALAGFSIALREICLGGKDEINLE